VSQEIFFLQILGGVFALAGIVSGEIIGLSRRTGYSAVFGEGSICGLGRVNWASYGTSLPDG